MTDNGEPKRLLDPAEIKAPEPTHVPQGFWGSFFQNFMMWNAYNQRQETNQHLANMEAIQRAEGWKHDRERMEDSFKAAIEPFRFKS